MGHRIVSEKLVSGSFLGCHWSIQSGEVILLVDRFTGSVTRRPRMGWNGIYGNAVETRQCSRAERLRGRRFALLISIIIIIISRVYGSGLVHDEFHVKLTFAEFRNYLQQSEAVSLHSNGHYRKLYFKLTLYHWNEWKGTYCCYFGTDSWNGEWGEGDCVVMWDQQRSASAADVNVPRYQLLLLSDCNSKYLSVGLGIGEWGGGCWKVSVIN